MRKADLLSSTVATLQDNSAHGEDNYLIRDLGNNAYLDAVMDGVTGHGGAEASQSLVDALAQASLTSLDDVVAVLDDVNQEFYQVGGGRFLLTTVSAALFIGGRLFVVGAGDSPIFLVRQDSFQQLSGRVGGFLHVGVARAIGASADLSNLYRSEVTIQPDDRVVLATDGVTDNLTTGELADIVRRAAAPAEAAEQIDRIIARRHEEGRLPEQLGSRFRRDDRTAIFRFFNPAG